LTIRDDWLSHYYGKTKSQALTSLNAWDRFVNNILPAINEESLLLLIKEGTKEHRYFTLDLMVQQWTKWEMSPATIRNYFTFIRSYLSRNDINTDLQDIKYHVKFPKRIKESKNAVTKELISKILTVCDVRYQALILSLASSGMRVGEILEARIGWLDFSFLESDGLVMIKIPALTTKGKSDRITFITNEAYESLKPFLKSKLSTTDHIFDISYGAGAEYMKWVRTKIGFDDRYSSGVHKLTIHSFRSFTRTVLSDHTTMEFAYFLLGQEGYLPEYYRKSPSEAAKLYKQAVPYLTIQTPITSSRSIHQSI